MESVLLYILGVVIIVVGLALSIALHELGHFVPAKLFGVKVGQFMVGFGPTLWSRTRGETEYGIKAIPLGGYISMAGMYPPEEEGADARTSSTGFFQTLIQDDGELEAELRSSEVTTATAPDDDDSRTFYRLPIWKRIIIMLGGPFMNLVIAVVLFGIILCGIGIPAPSTTLGTVNQCVKPASSASTECSSSDPLAPAAEAGMLPGDRVVSVDGVTVNWDQLSSKIRSSPGKPLTIVVDRDGKELTLTATPLLTEAYVVENGQYVLDADGNPVVEQAGMLGFSAANERQQQPISTVLPAVGDSISSVFGIILNLPQKLVDVVNAAFGPEERDPDGPISVVGVGRIAGEVTTLDTMSVLDKTTYLINIVGSLNIALLVFNLIPLLPLDGGHVAVALWEGIRRRFAKLFKRKDPGPVNASKLVPLTLVVVVLLGAMSLLLIYADIVKPISVL